MAPTMKAAVVRAFGKPLTIEEVGVPAPGPGEVLGKVLASGVRHTDLHAADGDWPVRPTLPFVPGHEGVGFVCAHVHEARLEDVTRVLSELRSGHVDGRIVPRLAEAA